MKEARQAKIVCTLGPVSNTESMIEKLAKAGMDVVRLNFSHGSHGEHARAIETVRGVSRDLEKPMSIIADLQGPKIRTGRVAVGKTVKLKTGATFTLTTENVLGDERRMSADYARLPREVKKGDPILLDDGLIELRVSSATATEVRCEVVNGGELGEHKGINLPGVQMRIESMTPKDHQDLRFSLDHGADYIAISFVRRAADIAHARAAARKLGADPLIIAKIEKAEALENLDEIMAVSDGIMVARGDLGVEMRPEKVPVAQKRILENSWRMRLPTITATQMLDSMTRNPRPTRAEASDVANAVFDGTSAVMLSNETATGRFPLEAVEMMDRIVREAEAFPRFQLADKAGSQDIADSISDAVCGCAKELGLKVIAVFTETGRSARLIAHYRPPCPIIAFSPVQETRRRLGLVWGVLPRKISLVKDIDDLASTAEKRLLEERLVKRGDTVGIVAGTPLGVRGTTNLLKLHRIGDPSS